MSMLAEVIVIINIMSKPTISKLKYNFVVMLPNGFIFI